ncbi:hypothetical protein LTR04_002429 [Oleoguttula sp. CCFEE 6159]|nr:hypothetical protein LTR04_002429 [Oleoguttula sp. CCFEE 6159]
MQGSEKTCSYKSVASDLPPAYTEKAAEVEAASSGRAFKPSSSCRLSRYPSACPACRLRYFRSLLRAWVLEQRKPYSAVTVQIDRLTGDQYEEDDLGGIIDLVEVIRIQGSGPTEAARAIRKKLKYGNAHRQIRALVILDGLMQNAGSRFQRAVADEPLLERLRILARDDMVDPEVRKRCNSLFRQWANAYNNTTGLEKIATLYKQLPTTTRPVPQQLKVLQETDADVETHMTLTAATKLSSSSVFKSSSKDNKDKPKRFNLEKEKPQILETIAGASVASTNLSNALQLVNRENERVSENKEVMSRFETCKILRRKILGYIQLVESEQWIGSLLTANDELVKALTAFEILDKSIDDDSDSAGDWDDDDDAKPSGTSTSTGQRGAAEALAGLNIRGGEAPPAKPPRPGTIAMPLPPHLSSTGKKPLRDSDSDSEEEGVDDDDPFGDENAVSTPRNERADMNWK